MLTGYNNRFDAAKEYEDHLFRAGYVLQSAELNEIQSNFSNKLKTVGDALFKDGNVVRDAQCIINAATGIVQCQAGAIYLLGAVRGVIPATLTVPTVGVVTLGVYLVTTAVTELEDPALRDPASLTRNYQEPGAGRRKVSAVWGFSGDGQVGDFYPVYQAENGILMAKEAPPNLDSTTQAIARYDRDSSGGTYVVSGLVCSMLPDAAGNQVYSVAEGKARVRGYGVEFMTATRLAVVPSPDMRFIDSEPMTSATTAAQRVNLNRSPVANITSVHITQEKSVVMTHGAFAGAQDPIADTSVISIVSVVQGATTFAPTTDYLLTAGAVNWSPAGAEPATGSSYTVTYRYIVAVTPTAVDSTGYTVTGAVVGSLILTSYNQNLPRLDRICVSEAGQLVYIKGVAADYNPSLPNIPDGLLPLATVKQTWDASRAISADGVRVVPMQELSAINGRLDYLLGMVAQQGLQSDIHSREAGAKKGLFTDPFLDDSQRDQGAAQTASIVNGTLVLPISGAIYSIDNRGPNAKSTLLYTSITSLSQLLRTGSMQVNPYMAFDIMPAPVTLSPSIDNWVDYQTVWTSSVTQVIAVNWLWWFQQASTWSTQAVGSYSTVQANLRQIPVAFSISGFGPNEVLASVTFDGIAVTANA